LDILNLARKDTILVTLDIKRNQ